MTWPRKHLWRNSTTLIRISTSDTEQSDIFSLRMRLNQRTNGADSSICALTRRLCVRSLLILQNRILSSQYGQRHSPESTTHSLAGRDGKACTVHSIVLAYCSYWRGTSVANPPFSTSKIVCRVGQIQPRLAVRHSLSTLTQFSTPYTARHLEK